MFKSLLVAAVALTILASAGVVTLTPDNFDAVVNDPSKHVFVKFYAPWCGHCVRMAPAWVDLAKAHEANADIVIAELDASAHSQVASKYGIRGFPTLKLFTKTDKAGLPYQGARDIKSFENFLATNAQ